MYVYIMYTHNFRLAFRLNHLRYSQPYVFHSSIFYVQHALMGDLPVMTHRVSCTNGYVMVWKIVWMEKTKLDVVTSAVYPSL